jgi:hypothetical protein
MQTVRLALALTLALGMVGCATDRSVVALAVKDVGNPTEGPAVRIEAVDDARVFQLNPPEPDIPSLMDGAITDKKTTERAIARKRNTFGAGLGDVLLPEGQTVPGLTRNALTRALREAGYRVLVPGDAGFDQATPVSARIDQFWAWFRPGFLAVTVSFRGNVVLRGNLAPLQSEPAVRADVQESMQAVFESDWQAVVQKGLDQWSANVRQLLEKK